MSLKVIDLFAGTGAFSYIFDKHNAEIVLANDYDINSKKIYEHNFDHKFVHCDIHDLTEIPEHDILCAGFPCQPFSISGKQEGFKDKRANVFHKIIDIMETHSPKIIILENVKNLLSHNKKKTFKYIHKTITDLDYYIKYSILNTCNVTNIPQNRERLFMVCFKDENTYNKFDMNFEKVKNKKLKDILETDIDEKYYYTDRFKVYKIIREQVTKQDTMYQYRRHYVRENKSNVCPTLTANMGSGGHNVPLLIHQNNIRKLTPRECFRLQGFPDSYKFPKMSDSALYKLAGNAITIPVIDLIVEKIMSILE